MDQISTFFHHFTWMDSLLLIVLLFSAVEGYALGAILATFDLVKFIAAFLVGLKVYALVATPLIQLLHISQGYANALGFFMSAFAVELLLQFSLRKVIKKVNDTSLLKKADMQQVNNILGIIPGLFSGGVLLMFILTVITTLPVSPFLKNQVNGSMIGSFLVDRSQLIERQIAGAFGGAASDTLNFLTVEPKSNTAVSLGFTDAKIALDINAEQQMLVMVNNQRSKKNLQPLAMDTKLQQLARDYAHEMLSRGYFSHYTPEGLSPFDRMSAQDIIFEYAGENLAFSPNVNLAMQGLMDSPGHRANILSPNFHRIGIGVLDAGVYGEMFVQEFTD